MSKFDFRKHPVFKLRPDLPEEIGFLDFLRKPIAFEVFASRRAIVEPLSPVAMQYAYEENCRCRALLPRQRFYGIRAYQPPEAKEVYHVFTDGIRPMPVNRDGLFFDCMVRANVALGLSPDGPYVIVPNQLRKGQMNEASHFIFYDAKHGRGYVAPMSEFTDINWRMRVDD
jgi:hypothetical protein